MSVPIPRRSDFDAATLWRAAKATKHAAQGRRLLALAEIYDGGTRSDEARVGGVGLQTVRDWVLAFNAEGLTGLISGKAPRRPSKLNDAQRRLRSEPPPLQKFSLERREKALGHGVVIGIAHRWSHAGLNAVLIPRAIVSDSRGFRCGGRVASLVPRG